MGNKKPNFIGLFTQKPRDLQASTKSKEWETREILDLPMEQSKYIMTWKEKAKRVEKVKYQTWKTWSDEASEGCFGLFSWLLLLSLMSNFLMEETRSDLFLLVAAGGISLIGESTSLEYLTPLSLFFFINNLDVVDDDEEELSSSCLRDFSGLLGMITERGSPTLQTAVAAVDWHMKPLIFLLDFLVLMAENTRCLILCLREKVIVEMMIFCGNWMEILRGLIKGYLLACYIYDWANPFLLNLLSFSFSLPMFWMPSTSCLFPCLMLRNWLLCPKVAFWFYFYYKPYLLCSCS